MSAREIFCHKILVHSKAKSGAHPSWLPQGFNLAEKGPFLSYCTWANLPYTEVGKSGHRTADLGSSNHTFFRGLELPTLAVLWPRCRTADLGSSMASFQHFRTFRHRTADLGSSMAAFQHFAQSLILKMS